MAHQSEDSIPLSGKEINIKEWNDLRKIAISEKDIHLFHLDTEDPYSPAEADAIVSNLNPALSIMAATSVVCFLASPENALHLIPEIQKSLNFKLWISIRRENPIAKENDLANAHMGLILFTKYSTALKHCKTQIAYTYCPACNKTTKDYGGKKHIYSPYGTLMSDVWRDITYDSEAFPSEIVERLNDLFGLPPYENLNYVDLRPLLPLFPRGENRPPVTDAKNPPVHHLEKSRLINADCFEAFREIPDNSIDFAFADPPYNIKKKYQNWDDAIDIKEYFNWCDEWLEEMARVVKPGRTVAVLNLPLWLVRHFRHIRSKLDFQAWITWEALGLPVRKIMPAHYGILCMSKGRPLGAVGKTDNIDWNTRYQEANILKQWYCTRSTCLKKRNGAGITDREALTDLWWDIHRLKHNSKRVDHPCQLPPQLMRRLISLYTQEGEFILDPFNGAGTTTLVARELKRGYIGFELSKYYHEIAQNRHEELEAGIDPFAKRKCTPTAKNSRVKRMKKQKYAVPKKTLQLDVKRIAEEIGRIPTREDVKAHSHYPFNYFEEYFIDWGEVCSAVGDKGMNEAPETEYEMPKYTQLTLFERRKRYALEMAGMKGEDERNY